MAANPNLSERLALEPGAREEFYAEYRALSPIGYANSLRALLAMDHITDQLPRLKMPTAVVVGEEDYAAPPAMAEALHKGIEGSTLKILSKGRHLTPLEMPDVIAAELEALMARIPR